MSVRVPISADARGVTSSIDQIAASIRRAGQEGRAFRDLDLSHPELSKFAEDIKKAQRNLEDLHKVSRGEAGRASRSLGGSGDLFGPTGLLGGGLSRRYPSAADQQRVESEAKRYIFNGTRFAPPPPPPPAPKPRPGGEDGEGGGGGAMSSLLGFGKMAGMFMLASAGIGKIVEMASKSVTQAREEALATDSLTRRLRDTGVSFTELRDSVMTTAKGLGVADAEAQRMAMTWVKLTNETSAKEALSAVTFAGGVARGYGVDQGSMVNGLGRAEFQGMDAKRFAFLLGDVMERGHTTGQVEQTMEALLRWSENASRTMVTHNNTDQFGEMYANMNRSDMPGMRGANAEALIGQINGAVTAGGAGGMASQALTYRGMARAGVTDPYAMQYLLAGGMFGSPKADLGYGSSSSNYEIMKSELDREYAGVANPYQKYAAFGAQFGVNQRQAQAMYMMPGGSLGKAHNWLHASGIDLTHLDPTAIADIGKVINTDDLGGYRDRMLKRKDLTDTDLSDLQGASGEDLRKTMVRILGAHGMEKTEGTRVQESMAELSNALTSAGRGLVPILSDMRSIFADMVGEVGKLSTWLADKYSDSRASPQMGNPDEAPEYDAMGNPVPRMSGGGQSDSAPAAGVMRTAGLGMREGKIRAAARKYNVSEEEALAIARLEGSAPGQVSPAGAVGTMQLMPKTAMGLGINPYDDDANIDGGVRYYAQLLRRFHGNKRAAAAAYNAGPNGAGVQNFADTGYSLDMPYETRKYVKGFDKAMRGGTPLPDGGGGSRPGVDVNVSGSHAPLEVRHVGADGDLKQLEYLPWTGAVQTKPWGML